MSLQLCVYSYFCGMLPLLGILDQLEKWDRALFVKLNSEWTNPLFDAVMPYLRNSNTWMPLYLFLLVLVLVNFRGQGLWWSLLFVSTIALTDMGGTYIFKHNIERFRPCNDPEMIPRLRLLLDKCAGGYGFISNHAANHVGMATYFFLTFRKIIPRWAWLGFPWAVAIMYAQVYVGVHYPADVLAGSLLGLAAGSLTSMLFNKRFGFPIFGNQSSIASS